MVLYLGIKFSLNNVTKFPTPRLVPSLSSSTVLPSDAKISPPPLQMNVSIFGLPSMTVAYTDLPRYVFPAICRDTSIKSSHDQSSVSLGGVTPSSLNIVLL